MTENLNRGYSMHVEATNLSARRGEDLIFEGVSFRLESGEALVLTGKNGSGKSTLLRVLAGLLRPEKGIVAVSDSQGKAERNLGEISHYLGHRNAMKSELTVAENLHLLARFPRRYRRCFQLLGRGCRRGRRPARHHPPPLRLSLRRPATPLRLRQAAHRPPPGLDPRRADGSTRCQRRRVFADLIEAHRKAGGIVIAATHQPLGLADARELKMTGFSGVDIGVWG
jgi:heme exporter protein A